MNKADIFSSSIENKKVLYIPILSMRDYGSGIYDLSSDGNVNRFISNFLSVPKEIQYHCTIILPGENQISKEGLILLNDFKSMADGRISLIHWNEYPSGGAQVLRSIEGGLKILNFIKPEIVSEIYDLIIYEGNVLGSLIESLKKTYKSFKTIYWCPVSATTEISPSFLESYKETDLFLSLHADSLWVASDNQYDYFKDYLEKRDFKKRYNVSIVANLINPALKIFTFDTDYKIMVETDKIISDGYKIVYLPFRLTDAGYHLKTIVNDVKSLSKGFGIKIAVLYGDPNKSQVLDDEKDTEFLTWIKIPTNRNTYYTMLSQVDCIVPYLEDTKNILHATINELLYYQTKTIFYKNEYLVTNMPQIHSISEFQMALYKLLTKKKPKLIVLEGFDRIGKDSLLSEFKKSFRALNNKDNSCYVYIQNPKDLPNYRNEKEKFVSWLKDYLKEQAKELIVDSLDYQNILMTRLFVSDYVYGRLFNREPVAEIQRAYLSRYFEFETILLLWKDYDEYLKRVKSCNEEIEYSKEEFEKIQKFYLSGLSIEQGNHHIIYVQENQSKEEIYDLVNEKLEKIYGQD